ncbi:MAG TPA: hypothetical protein VHN99_03490 [Deinococcales bacterium]|nr:hypothetical protein [Deinococcales bacterium]
MKAQPAQNPILGWVWLGLAIVAGVILGLALRPAIGRLLNPGANQPPGTVSSVCKDPTLATLVLTESLNSQASDGKITYARSYTLQRPGQPTFAFNAGGDASNAPLDCANVRFGPGPRLSFGRGPEAITLEYVGPLFHHFSLLTDKAVAAFAVQPRWKLNLNLADYSAGPPELDQSGRGTLAFTRASATPGLPQRLAFTTQDSGNSYQMDPAATLASVVQ